MNLNSKIKIYDQENEYFLRNVETEKYRRIAVYFNQLLGAAHFKCWLKSSFSAKKAEKMRKSNWSTVLLPQKRAFFSKTHFYLWKAVNHNAKREFSEKKAHFLGVKQ